MMNRQQATGQGGIAQMAAPQQQALKVHVTEKVLWIGSDAYPVQNIARARVRELVPRKRKSPWASFRQSLAWWLTVAIFGMIVVTVNHIQVRWEVLIFLVPLAFIAIAAVRLVTGLHKRDVTYYALAIETAGTAWDALISDNRGAIEEIIANIINAINGMAVDFQRVVNNYVNIGHHYGDNINQYGGHHNIGKR
jgi:hypothetical protein